MEKSGLSRLAHNQQVGGSNPSPATMKYTVFIIFTIAVMFGCFIATIELHEESVRDNKRRWNNLQQSYDTPMVVAFRRARDGLLIR